MAFSEMSLPTDIPWRRIGVSSLDIVPKSAAENSPYINASVTIFAHEPKNLPPEYCNRIITYLKLTCTFSNLFKNNGNIGEKDILSVRHESWPCYGANLNVRVFPKENSNEIEKHDYPYFTAAEPRKREMYEIISKSNEALSNSNTQINVSKGSTSTNSSEFQDTYDNHYNFEKSDLDLGGAVDGSYSGGFGIYSEQGGHDARQRDGWIRNSGYKDGWIRTSGNSDQNQKIISTDSSRQNRETISYSTNINHIYSLLQSYGLGTNNILFTLKPRPHLVENYVEFKPGIKRLDGVQDFFLIVNRPKSIKGLCVKAYLHTLYFNHELTYRLNVVPRSLLGVNDNLNKTPEALGLDLNRLSLIDPLAGVIQLGISYWNNYDVKYRIFIQQYLSRNTEGVNINSEGLNSVAALLTSFPRIGLEDAFLIFEPYYKSNIGEFVNTRRIVEGCFTSNIADEGNIETTDEEQSEPGHLSDREDDFFVVAEGKYEHKLGNPLNGSTYQQDFIEELNYRMFNEILKKDKVEGIPIEQSNLYLDRLRKFLLTMEKMEAPEVLIKDILEDEIFLKLPQKIRDMGAYEFSKLSYEIFHNSLEIDEKEARLFYSKILSILADKIDIASATKPAPNPIIENLIKQYSDPRYDRIRENPYFNPPYETGGGEKGKNGMSSGNNNLQS